MLMRKAIIIYKELPLEIITPKISNNRTNSLFYDGKNIARVTTAHKKYVLTTAGEYKFT